MSGNGGGDVEEDLPKVPLGSYRKGQFILTPQCERWGEDFTEADFGRWRSVAMALIQPTANPTDSSGDTKKMPSTEAGMEILHALQRAITRQLLTHQSSSQAQPMLFSVDTPAAATATAGNSPSSKSSGQPQPQRKHHHGGKSHWREQVYFALMMTVAEAWEFVGDHTKALQQYDGILAKVGNGANPKLEATALLSSGSAYLKLNQSEQALQTFQKALALSKDISSAELQAVAHLKLGNFYENSNPEKLPSAQQEYEQAFSCLQAAGDLSGCGTALLELGRISEKLNQTEPAIKYYQQLLAIVRGGGGGSSNSSSSSTEEEIKLKLRLLQQRATAATMPSDID